MTTTSVGLVATEVVTVATRTAIAVPPQLARRGNRVLRPRDATEIYANPRSELARLARTGVVRRLSTGYYALAPQHRLGDRQWRPDLHSAALGIAQADYGRDAVALMGVSAARQHGAIPRAVAVAVVAVPKQRPTLRVDDGELVFVERDVSRLDVERLDSELTTGWVTTVEQTLLDLASRPTLGGLTVDESREAARALAARADWEVLVRLAKEQRRPSALRRAREWTGRPADA